ncbi:uncharacterized protein AB675_5178 [Cyphellophora attinorum]|uniref:Uncharacterized protein n=1 Tax=Cyphellophora attinorum TaxID=1664694 RepID=A0A0N1H371_9EURO|nr:uncharacterized protein AB675_5178 [Phialophora attinorum]KPI39364.1 hypothetical protein AB675_5178 [Phialophora attinorum]
MKSVVALASLLPLLASAAPTPQGTVAVPAFTKGQIIGITQQLNREDTANTTGNAIVEAAVTLPGPAGQTGPWCAGFSDDKAQNVVKSINNKLDGIFNSERTASYGDVPVVIASYWCAATRLEVEQFVAKIGPFAPKPDTGAAPAISNPAASATTTTTTTASAATATATASLLPKGTKLTITQQLDRQDTANTVDGLILGTTPTNPGNVAVEAAVNEVGPWCAGFSDAKAQNVVKSINEKKDGIFNSVRPASYGNTPVPIGSYWCANTRLEVEQFVAKVGPFAPKPAAGADTGAVASPVGSAPAAGITSPPVLGAGKVSAPVTVTVTVTAPASCDQQQGPWSKQGGWKGQQNGGNLMDMLAGGSN